MRRRHIALWQQQIAKVVNLLKNHELLSDLAAKNLLDQINELIQFKKEEILAHTIENTSQLTEYKRYKISELIVLAVYPKFKFPEFERIWLDDMVFLNYYKSVMDPNNWHSYDRKYTLQNLVRSVVGLEGDIAEAGVYKGASAYLMCEENLSQPESKVYLFDSFQGLSKPKLADGNYWTEGVFSTPVSELATTLKEFNNYVVLEGWIPSRYNEIEDKIFKFVHIDVDLFEPTFDSISFFYHRVVPGGMILLDDYGFYSCPGAKKAVDKFMKDKTEKIINLTTGQGLIIKI
jgi:predicted house-cleaning noncanonical NTP pyrophosphatase (MazG superfamily)